MVVPSHPPKRNLTCTPSSPHLTTTILNFWARLAPPTRRTGSTKAWPIKDPSVLQWTHDRTSLSIGTGATKMEEAQPQNGNRSPSGQPQKRQCIPIRDIPKGFLKEEVPGDGACLFHCLGKAFSHTNKRDLGHPSTGRGGGPPQQAPGNIRTPLGRAPARQQQRHHIHSIPGGDAKTDHLGRLAGTHGRRQALEHQNHHRSRDPGQTTSWSSTTAAEQSTQPSEGQATTGAPRRSQLYTHMLDKQATTIMQATQSSPATAVAAHLQLPPLHSHPLQQTTGHSTHSSSRRTHDGDNHHHNANTWHEGGAHNCATHTPNTHEGHTIPGSGTTTASSGNVPCAPMKQAHAITEQTSKATQSQPTTCHLVPQEQSHCPLPPRPASAAHTRERV